MKNTETTTGADMTNAAATVAPQTFTYEQITLIRRLSVECFDIRTLAAMNMRIQTRESSITIKGLLDFAGRVASGGVPWNQDAHSFTVATEIVRCLPFANLSEGVVDQMVETGLLKALRASKS